MKTNRRLIFPEIHAATRLGRFAAVLAAVILSASATAGTRVPDPVSGRLAGIYKVTSSSDPMFPATRTCEYFLDFGRGIQVDKQSGSVAVSERRNPNVRVRVMAWQYFPDQGTIVVGNPYAEGSRKAVARGVWRMRGISQGVIFERGTYQIILQRADPKDY